MWKVEANWNRRLAFRAEGTSAAISEMLRGFITGNFVNVAKCEASRIPWPSIDDLQRLDLVPDGAHIDDYALNGYVSNETGRASWSVWRVN
jgi:hypothetical protein